MVSVFSVGCKAVGAKGEGLPIAAVGSSRCCRNGQKLKNANPAVLLVNHPQFHYRSGHRCIKGPSSFREKTQGVTEAIAFYATICGLTWAQDNRKKIDVDPRN